MAKRIGVELGTASWKSAINLLYMPIFSATFPSIYINWMVR